MDLFIALIIGAALGWFGHREWLKRKAPPAPGVKPQGGGPGSTPPPPQNGG